MTGAQRIERAIRRANDAGRPALAAFITAGYPERDAFPRLLRAVAAAADIVEVGIPFSDPMADGLTIQRASRAALESGVTLRWILSTLATVRVDTPVVVMSYLNPLLAIGIDRLPGALAEAGVAGAIVPDLPLEEADEMRAGFDGHGLALVQLVTPVTPQARLARLCAGSSGFVYAVATTGTTGGPAADMGAIASYLDRVKAASPVPVMAGFGFRTRAQVDAVAPHADGVIVGSALIEALERGDDPAAFLGRLR